MREELQALKEQALAELGAVTTPDELKDLRIKYLGKKGPMTEILRGMGALPAEERPKIGQIVNEVKSALETAINAKTEVLEAESLKARLANESGADYFISFHRNSSPESEQYNGVEVLVYDKKGIKYQMAQNIEGALGELGFQKLGVKERPGLVVLRRTKMPALLIETGFINSEKDNQLFDEKFEEIARSIADAILGTLDEETVDAPLYYRVQTGAFRNRENADRMLYQLTDQGFPAFILKENDLYKVQVGAYMQLGNAVNMEQRLRDSGYSTVIVTK